MSTEEHEGEPSLSFGKWVAAWREHLGLTITDAAQKAGWKISFWHRQEAEPVKEDKSIPRPSKNTVLRIALALDLPESLVLCAAGYAPEAISHSALQVLPCARLTRMTDEQPLNKLVIELYKTYGQNRAMQESAKRLDLAA